MATEHSQKCCEELVAVGAVGTLLKLIRSVSRSIPDQQVLKHALSTLRNLARYPHLTVIVIENRGSVETILWEFLRCASEFIGHLVGTISFNYFELFLFLKYFVGTRRKHISLHPSF